MYVIEWIRGLEGKESTIDSFIIVDENITRKFYTDRTSFRGKHVIE